MQKEQKLIYKCITCRAEYAEADIIYLCPLCSRHQLPDQPPAGVLKIRYDYHSLKNKNSEFNQLKQNGFIDILPISDHKNLPNLKIGNTPLYTLNELGEETLPFRLHLKDDSQNPTFSFKDRASAMVSAFAKERKLDTIVAASTGNAGSSLAGICAAQNQRAVIMVPETAPIAKLTQIMMYGATIIPVKGGYDQAFDLSIAATEKFGWYNRNTAYNPLTIEGKKMVAFELFEQLDFNVPDRLFVPVGDGVILAGVYKGFEDLMELGIISHIPLIIAVQSTGSDNLIRNITNRVFESRPGKTIADSICVDIPRNFYMAKQFIEKYNGDYISVSDDEILFASQLLAKTTGIFTEPASAAAFAGMLAFKQQHKIADNSSNVVMLTGSGLKDIKALAGIARIPEAIDPDPENLIKFKNL
jgi:threonine synthase